MIWTLILLALAVAAPFAAEARRTRVDARRAAGTPGTLIATPSGRTHIRWHGGVRGPVCVCIHGLSTPSAVWDALVPHLTDIGYRVLTYDLYGRGLSDRVAGPQDRAFFLRQLREVLAHEGVGDVTLIGYSMGGSIAAAFAAEEPARLDRLVLVASASLGHEPGRLGRLAARFPGLGDWFLLGPGAILLRRSLRQGGAAPDLLRAQLEETRTRGFLPAVLSSQRNMLAAPQTADHVAIAAADIPLLAIWGSEDTAIPGTSAGRLAEIDRHAWQETVAGAGHGLPHTHASEVAEAFRAFLRRTA